MCEVLKPCSRRRLEMRGRATRFRGGFTLIELLIVVAIISILAAIAIPNYQTALVKSKISRFMGDGKAAETGLELYYADHNTYPSEDYYPAGSSNTNWDQRTDYPAAGFLPRAITTPLSYLATLPTDPFPNLNANYDEPNYPQRRTYNYTTDSQNARIYAGGTNQYYVSWTYAQITGDLRWISSERPNAAMWLISSACVDGDRDYGSSPRWTNTPETGGDSTSIYPIVYDPTNGTQSSGDLFMFGPGLGFPGQ